MTATPTLGFDIPDGWEMVESSSAHGAEYVRFAAPTSDPQAFRPAITVTASPALQADGLVLSASDMHGAQLDAFARELTDYTLIDDGVDVATGDPAATIACRQGIFGVTGRVHSRQVADWNVMLFGTADIDTTPVLCPVFDEVARSVRLGATGADG